MRVRIGLVLLAALVCPLPKHARLLRAWVGPSTASAASAARGPELDAAAQKELREAWQTILVKKKGPYTQNYCVCADGSKRPVMAADGRITSPCGPTARFCAAYRAPWAETLAKHGMWVGNIFSRDLALWDEIPDHHDLVRGYVLEKFFVETNPNNKLTEMRAYGGLSGAEYEARDAPLFFERYLADPTFDPERHYLLAYELQRRFFVRDAQGQIQRVRNLASRIYAARKDFKPLRDETHNRVSEALVPKLEAYRAKVPPGGTRNDLDALIQEVRALTALDASVLPPQVRAIENEDVREKLLEHLPDAKGASKKEPASAEEAVESIRELAEMMIAARQAVAEGKVSPADRRRLVDVSITAAAVIQATGARLLDEGPPLSVRQSLGLLAAFTDAAYGAGLLNTREWKAASEDLRATAEEDDLSRAELRKRIARARLVVEWSQGGVAYAFEEVRAPWSFLLPPTALIGDDVLRGSPLLLYGRVLEHLDDHAAGGDPVRHAIFGEQVSADVRALNPGLAMGRLRVDPKPTGGRGAGAHGSSQGGGYSRDEIVVLPETPADLQPAAGIVTRGEGNVVSHVQLLARSLGIPNVVVGPSVYRKLQPHDGESVMLLVTPGGRVHLKNVASLTDAERTAVAEFRKSSRRPGEGSLGRGGSKLQIDRTRLDLSSTKPLPLDDVRRVDSGIRTGPKAAYLGELHHLFPDKVARGVVVPFGVYYEHYRRAKVALPPELAGSDVAKPGEPLPEFVTRTYATFFNEMIAAGTSEEELSAWIRPRLDVVRHSIRAQPLSPELRAQIRDALAKEGLLDPSDPTQTVGCFVRSDTNVEDLDDFSGAGLNLTLFHLRSLEDVYDGIREVWASPFSYRSFAWRQTLIDEPLWVLPSIVILESVPSDKSGVLVTADLDTGDAEKMLVATSEGVGGAVDGTPAETLVWSPEGVELRTMFKSPWRRMLQPGGGSAIVAASGKDHVLSEDELDELVGVAGSLREQLAPAKDGTGRARPWDVEFGFSGGKLWLFQARPFIGNDDLANLPALRALDGARARDDERLSLEETVG